MFMLQNQWFSFEPRPSYEELELAVQEWTNWVRSQHWGIPCCIWHHAGKQAKPWLVAGQCVSIYTYSYLKYLDHGAMLP